MFTITRLWGLRISYEVQIPVASIEAESLETVLLYAGDVHSASAMTVVLVLHDVFIGRERAGSKEGSGWIWWDATTAAYEWSIYVDDANRLPLTSKAVFSLCVPVMREVVLNCNVKLKVIYLAK